MLADRAHAVGGAAARRLDAALFVLGGVVAIGLGLRLAWAVLQGPTEITWDGGEYARAAENLHAGLGYIGLRGGPELIFPPLYSLAIAAVMALHVGSESAGVAVSILAGAAFALPVYGVARLLYGRSAGLIAAAIAASVPFAVDMSVLVLSDALFLTLAATGLYFTVRVALRARSQDALGCGLAYALAYLARPEGFVLALAALATFAFAALLLAPLRGRLLRCAALTVLAFAVPAAPYVAFLSAHAGHLRIEGKSLTNYVIAERMRAGLSYTVAADAIDAQLHRIGPELDDGYFFEPAGVRWPTLSEALSQALVDAGRHLREVPRMLVARSFGTPLLPLLMLLGWLRGPWNRRRAIGEFAVAAYALAAFAALASVYHFWDRYADGFLAVIAIWGASGLEAARQAIDAVLRRRGGWHVPSGVVAACVMLGYAAILLHMRATFRDNVNDAADLNERIAGRWLATQHVRPNDWVLSVSDQSVYYGGGRWRMLPYASDAGTALRYVRASSPAWLVLDRDQQTERPYLAQWLQHGVPDARATRVYVLGDPRDPTVAIYSWAG